MSLIKPSSNNITYLITLQAPQSVEITAARLQGMLKKKGCTLSPIPPGIPILQLKKEPGEPVPGNLPICNEPLKMTEQLIIDNKNPAAAGNFWIIWPVKTSRWLTDLYGALVDFYSENSTYPPEELLFPKHRGIPLAAVTGEEDAFLSEVFTHPDSPLRKTPGWRALKLVCWKVESSGTYPPWYKAVVWTPLWHRRLRRAPKLEDSSKDN